MNLKWSDWGIYCTVSKPRKQKLKSSANKFEAFELCGEVRTGKVFKGLTRSMINHALKNRLEEAVIEKHVTFYYFRHYIFLYSLKITDLLGFNIM